MEWQVGDRLKHGNGGQRSNHARSKKFQQKVMGVVKKKYSGAVDERFGPTPAAERLAEEDGFEVDAETLRRWMLKEGFCGPGRGAGDRIGESESVLMNLCCGFQGLAR